MVDLLANSAAPIPATTEQAFLFLGMLFLVGATYAWTERDVFAQKRRRRFEKLGWVWWARQMKEERWRRGFIFFAIVWAATGIVLVVTSFVLFALPG